MTTKKSDPAEALLKMMAFQYKPIEKFIKENAAPAEWAFYKALPATQKIIKLDMVAERFGL